MTAQILYLPIIPRKPADRKTHAFTAHLAERDYSELFYHRCIQCGLERGYAPKPRHAVYCPCGAEMRPVEK